MYERIKQMTKEEMQKFIYWVYLCGNADGKEGLQDSTDGLFGGHILDMSAEELMPNGVEDLFSKQCDEMYADLLMEQQEQM